jgi:hypothetical protein
VGVEPNQTNHKKAWTSINHSILSAAMQRAKDLYLFKVCDKVSFNFFKNFVSNFRKTIVKKSQFLLLRKEVIQRLIPSHCIFS